MKVIALMAWYDESPKLLWQAVRSLEGVADHLIAVDGAYALFPRGKAKSPKAQHDEISEAADAAGITHQIYTPPTVWEHNECEKREFMFRLGEECTTTEDWYLIMDADDMVTKVGPFRTVLRTTPWDVAAVQFEKSPFRKLFRALRGITVEGSHYVFKHGDRYLWGHPSHHVLEPCADARMLKIEHFPEMRTANRNDRKTEYYRVRHAEQAEWVPLKGGRKTFLP